MDRLVIHIDNGKYTLVQHQDGSTEILRYGEEWLKGDIPGMKAILSMGYELQELRELKEIYYEN